MVKVVTDKRQLETVGKMLVCKLEKDTSLEVAYDVENILEIDNVKNFTLEEEKSIEIDYAGGKTFKKRQSKNGGTFSLEMANYPDELQEMLDGAERDEDVTIIYRDSDITPSVGFIYELKFDDGSVGYVGATNVTVNRAGDTAATSEEGVAYTAITLEGVADARIYDGIKKLKTKQEGATEADRAAFIAKVFKNAVKDEGTEA